MDKKILHISTSDKGGAATACLRLHFGMLKYGLKSKVLVLDKHTNSNTEVFQFWDYKKHRKPGKAFNFLKRHIIPYFNERKLKGKPEEYEIFTFPNSCFDITSHPLYEESDIIHIHFVADFLNWNTFFKKNKKPIVWTLHDMNPFTGGCHYSAGCKNFTGECSDCPQLLNAKNSNLSRKILFQKIRLLNNQEELKIVSPSIWLKYLAEQSKVFQNKNIIKIGHSIDNTIFKPHNKKFARELFGISINKFVILFAPDDIQRKNKGMDFIPEILKYISHIEDIQLCLIGKNTESVTFEHPNIIKLGYINNEQMMSLAYSSADLTLVPSREEAFSLTTLESLACGTPVIAFRSTGPDDIIIHKKNGWLADDYSSKNFSEGILWFNENPDELQRASEFAVKHTTENFNPDKQIEAYLAVYAL